MRILISTFSSRRVGGTETYIGRLIALLTAAGHDVALVCEIDEPADRAAIPLPPGVRGFRVGAAHPEGLAAVRAWRPDVSYSHGLLDPEVEGQLLTVAPAVFFAHSYYGTCISGEKTHKFPVAQPCARRFGPACLALYFPRRCGGLSPATMVGDYARQRRRLSLLRRYAAVVTSSEHMRDEFARHGAAGGRVFNVSYSVTGTDHSEVPAPVRRGRAAGQPWRLMFVGRMDRLKGGATLIDALPPTQAQFGHRLHLTFAGEGPARPQWAERAASMVEANGQITVEFAGWLPSDALIARFDATDVVVVPSLWPEPFGLVGPEANRRGVPVVAFATGGIPEWLHEGINGCLAPANPPTAAGLSDALLRCLRSLDASDAMRLGAIEAVNSRPDAGHLQALLDILGRAASHAYPVGA